MELSALNRFKGKVTGIITGGVMAEVTVDVGHGMEVVSSSPSRRPSAWV